MYRESDPIPVLKGVGDKTELALKKLGIQTVGDLLMHLPVRYEDFEPAADIDEAHAGRVVAARGIIYSAPMLRRTGRRTMLTTTAVCNGILFNLIWFHMPYLKNKLKKGSEFVFRGKLIKNRFGYGFEQPLIYSVSEYDEMAGTLQPVFRSSSGLSGVKIHKLIKEAIENIIPEPDPLPLFIREKYGLMERMNAVKALCFPERRQDIIPARRRLVFGEFLDFIIGIRKLREETNALPNTYDFSRGEITERFLASLPYELTGAQKKVLSEVRADLTGQTLMKRLIQGDVGSGKTIISLLALMLAAENGYQGAIMAPTEVLAKQHYENFSAMFSEYGVPFGLTLLTGSMTAKEKREAYERIAAHETDIIIGTHALISEGVKYDRLAIVITDEQHRFGVRQRDRLAAKAEESDAGRGGQPHVLVMSATPIPRTLAIIVYGDLDLSIIDEMPKGRIPVKNCVVGQNYRKRSYDFIRDQVRAGHQAYVVCPKVNNEEESEGENVVDYTEILRENLPPAIRVEYLHGKMRPSEKEDIMERFLSGEIQVLVSTTVIEVGVDVSNATVMMIEDAERFGLAQLHQLRGRVGRGSAQSYCIFINGSGDPEKQKRLEILNNSNDGFKIASEDLKLRGPGDIFGIRQSGALQFAIGDIYTDSAILKEAAEAADLMMKQ